MRTTEPTPDRDGRWMRQRGMRIVACTVQGADFKDDDADDWLPVSSAPRGWRGMTDLDPEAFLAFERAGNVRVR